MAEDNAAMSVAIIALGAVTLFAVLYFLVFADFSKQSDVTDAHLHDDAEDNAVATGKLDERVTRLEQGGKTMAPAAVPEPVDDDETTGDDKLDALVKKILDATSADERSKAFADIISKALNGEELSAVVAGISPMAGSGGTVSSMTDLERLKELARILKDGDVSGGLAMTGGSPTNLSALYEAVVNSLSDSNVISDQTRTLLSFIKMQKCQRDFASDPAKLTACLTAAPAPAPTAGGTTPSTTPPGSTAPLQTPPTVVSDMTVLADGLTVKTGDGKTAKFTFDTNRLTVCADKACKSAALF